MTTASIVQDATSHLQSQWVNSNSILDLLLLVDSDVIAIVLAQLTESHWSTSVIFSFDWVIYIFKQIVLIFEHNHLLISIDISSLVINEKSDYVRMNQFWILERMLRDFENEHWMHSKIGSELQTMLMKERRSKVEICIFLFNMTFDKNMLKIAVEFEGRDESTIELKCDTLWKLDYVVAFLQLEMTAIFWSLWDNWKVFVVTAFDTILFFLVESMH